MSTIIANINFRNLVILNKIFLRNKKINNAKHIEGLSEHIHLAYKAQLFQNIPFIKHLRACNLLPKSFNPLKQNSKNTNRK